MQMQMQMGAGRVASSSRCWPAAMSVRGAMTDDPVVREPRGKSRREVRQRKTESERERETERDRERAKRQGPPRGHRLLTASQPPPHGLPTACSPILTYPDVS
jgi:hypothetical protein